MEVDPIEPEVKGNGWSNRGTFKTPQMFDPNSAIFKKGLQRPNLHDALGAQCSMNFPSSRFQTNQHAGGSRRGSSGVFITSMFGSRFRHLQKLHTEGFMLGLNSVCVPGLPVGTMFRSSLPSTPVSTPVHRESFQHFTEEAIRERLCQTPSPQKMRTFSPLAFQVPSKTYQAAGDALNITGSDSVQSMDITSPTSPIPENVQEIPSGDEESNGEQASETSSSSYINPKKIFVGSISYRVRDE